MEDKDKDILEKLQKESEQIQPPPSLEPEELKSRLAQKGKVRKFPAKTLGAIAASLALIIGGSIFLMNRQGQTILTPDTDHTGRAQNETTKGAESLQAAKDYGEVYQVMAANQTEGGFSGEVMVEDAVTLEADMAAPTAGGNAKSMSSSGVYSDTNVRQEGVGEADIVKTDGRYLYVLKDNGYEVAIVDTEGEKLKDLGTILIDEVETVREFYYDNERLVVVGETYGEENYTRVLTYNVKDKENPELIGNVKQSGSYQSSRFVDGYIYLFTNYYSYHAMEKSEPITYIPSVNGELIEAKNIILPPYQRASEYTVISSLKLEKPDKIVDSKAIMKAGGELYVSNENIYFYEVSWQDGYGNDTNIRKISYQKGEFSPVAVTNVSGYIKDSFCIDEYQGNLRIVVTNRRSETNGLYILDEKLKDLGKITGLAKGERIYSARLMGETGYFVTFKETDPLFSVDLSDPKSPKVLGALKIPGFSEYLHPYGENRLLGIGMDADEETGMAGSVKLSMFATDDPSDVEEIHKLLIENTFYSSVLYDYKALMISADHNLFGFATEGEGGQKYQLFTYNDEEGFVRLLEEEVNGTGSREARSVVIENRLYVIKGNIIEAYSLDTYEEAGNVIL
ncbi:putative secreted protein with C-terminal beta-propeller domain [Lachnospiraceae bacterium PF1-21]